MSQAGTTSITITGGALNTLTPDVGGAVSPVANNIDIHGTNGITTTNTGAGSLTISGTSLLQTLTVNVTAAEVKNLSTVPKTIIPAPGVGSVISVYTVNYKLSYGGTSAFVDNGSLDFAYYDAGGPTLYLLPNLTGTNVNTFIQGTSDLYCMTIGNLVNAGVGSIYSPTQIENLPVVLSNGGADIAGNAADDNVLIVNIQYITITI